jgi:hypothetical protein
LVASRAGALVDGVDEADDVVGLAEVADTSTFCGDPLDPHALTAIAAARTPAEHVRALAVCTVLR